MDAIKVAEYARALRDVHGPKAQVEAAKQAHKHEESGNRSEADNWRRIREALSVTSPPHQS